MDYKEEFKEALEEIEEEIKLVKHNIWTNRNALWFSEKEKTRILELLSHNTKDMNVSFKENIEVEIFNDYDFGDLYLKFSFQPYLLEYDFTLYLGVKTKEVETRVFNEYVEFKNEVAMKEVIKIMKDKILEEDFVFLVSLYDLLNNLIVIEKSIIDLKQTHKNLLKAEKDFPIREYAEDDTFKNIEDYFMFYLGCYCDCARILIMNFNKNTKLN